MVGNTIPQPSAAAKSLDETEFARTLLLLNKEADGYLDPVQTVDELSSLINVLLVRSLAVTLVAHTYDNIGRSTYKSG